MRVLMIGPARTVKGGISAVVNNYYSIGLDKMVDLQYLATMEDGSKLHKLKVALFALIKYPFKAVGVDIIHVHMASDSSLLRKLPFLLLAKWMKKKVVLHQHGGDFTEYYYHHCSKRLQKLIITILNKADLVLVVSPHLKEEFGKILEISKIQLFQNTILIPKYEKNNYQGNDLLFLGRLCVEKGIGELLEAVIQLKKEITNLHLYLGGVWEDLELKKVADEHKEFIHQIGWVENKEKEKWLEKCNVFVLPTYFEGLPIALLEAMAYGCACVASKVGGIPKLITHKQEGLLIEPKNSTCLLDCLRYLLREEKMQEQLGQAAAKKVQREYNLENQLQQLIRWYRELEIN